MQHVCPVCSIVVPSEQVLRRHRELFCTDPADAAEVPRRLRSQPAGSGTLTPPLLGVGVGGGGGGGQRGGGGAAAAAHPRALTPQEGSVTQQQQGSELVRSLLAQRGVDGVTDRRQQQQHQPSAREALLERLDADTAALRAAGGVGRHSPALPDAPPTGIGSYSTLQDPRLPPRHGRRAREGFASAATPPDSTQQQQQQQHLHHPPPPTNPLLPAHPSATAAQFFPQQRQQQHHHHHLDPSAHILPTPESSNPYAPHPPGAPSAAPPAVSPASSASVLQALDQVRFLREGLAVRGESQLLLEARAVEASLEGIAGPQRRQQHPHAALLPALQAQLQAMMAQMQGQMEDTARLLDGGRQGDQRDLEAEVDELRRELALTRGQAAEAAAAGEGEDDEVKRLQKEMHRLRQQQEVNKLRLAMQREQEDWARQAAEQRRREDEEEARRLWEEEQRGKPSQGPGNPAIPFDMDHGFIVFFDRVTGLPGRDTPLTQGWPGGEVRLVYSFFCGGRQVFPLRELPPCGAQQDPAHPAFRRCALAQRRKVLGVEMEPGLALLLEVQLVLRHPSQPGEGMGTAPHAWTLIPIASPSGALAEGAWRAPLFFCPVEPGADPGLMDESFKRLEMHGGGGGVGVGVGGPRHQCCVRVVPPRHVAVELSRGESEVHYRVPRIYREGEVEARARAGEAVSDSSSSGAGFASSGWEGRRKERKKKKAKAKGGAKPEKRRDSSSSSSSRSDHHSLSENAAEEGEMARRRSSRRRSTLRKKSSLGTPQGSAGSGGGGTTHPPTAPASRKPSAATSAAAADPQAPASSSSTPSSAASAAAEQQQGRGVAESAAPTEAATPTASSSSSEVEEEEELRPPSVDYACATGISPLDVVSHGAPRCSALKLTCRVVAAGGSEAGGGVSWALDPVPARPAKGGTLRHSWGGAVSRTLPHHPGSTLLCEVWTGHSLTFAERLLCWAALPCGAPQEPEGNREVTLTLQPPPVLLKQQDDTTTAPSATTSGSTPQGPQGKLRLRLCRADPKGRQAAAGYARSAHPAEAEPPEPLWLPSRGRSSREAVGPSTALFIRIDRARFLPANVSASRVVGRFFGKPAGAKARSFSPCGGEEGGLFAAVQDVATDVAHPAFTCPLRGETDGGYHGKLAASCLQGLEEAFCLLDVEIVDASTGRPAVLGYAALPIVEGGAVVEQRVQVRLRVGPLPPKPVTPFMMDSAAHFPLATLLVTVSCSVPQPPAPYASGEYATRGARPDSREEEIFRSFDHRPRHVTSTLAAKLPRDATVPVIRERVEKLLGSPDRMPAQLANPSFVSRFSPGNGVAIHVSSASGLHQGKGFAYKVVVAVHPGGPTWFTQRSDWSASTAAPRWFDEPHVVRSQSFAAEAVVFFEVVRVGYAGGAIVPEGWGALRLMQPGGVYAQHGKFRIPLYKGRVGESQLLALQGGTVEAFLAERSDSQLLRWATLTVALTDGLRQSELRSDTAKAKNLTDAKHAASYAAPPATLDNLRSTLPLSISEGDAENATNAQLEEKTGFKAVMLNMRKQSAHDMRRAESLRRASSVVPEAAQQQQQQQAEEVEAEQPQQPARVVKTLQVTKNAAGKVGVKYSGSRVDGLVPGGAGEAAGLAPGMVLEQINGQQVPHDTAAVRSAFSEAPSSFEVVVSVAEGSAE